MKKLTTVLFLLTLASCGKISSEEVQQDVIVTNYSAVYSEDDEKFTLKGEFTLKDSFLTYVTLDGASSLYIDGIKAQEKKDLLTYKRYYQTEYYTKAKGLVHTFSYTNEDGEVFNNTISIPSEFDVNLGDSVSADEELEITWAIDDMYDEATAMTVEFNTGTGFTSMNYSANSTVQSVSIKLSEIFPFPDQTITETVEVVVCREKYNSLNEHPGAGGSISSKYCSKSKNVRIH